MLSNEKFHICSFITYGINLDDRIINWKNKIFFGKVKMLPDNICHSYSIVFGRDHLDEVRRSIEDWAKIQSKFDAKAIHPILLFFACYHLINPNRKMPKISKSSLFRITTNYLEKNAAEIYGHCGDVRPDLKTELPKMTHDESFESMTNTLPLFDKAMSQYDDNTNKMKPLIIALLLYQRAIEENDHLISFLDLVMTIEALFSDGEGEIRFKLSQRTANFSESLADKKKEVFDTMRKIYKARNALVHGSDIDLDKYGDYYNHKINLLPIVQNCLLKYIDKNFDGMSKTDIINELNNAALGINQ